MSDAGPIAWITGASQGIGRALTVELVQRGWRVAISARDAAALAKLERAHPGRVLAQPLDVTDLHATGAVIAAVEAHWGPIQLALLNAGTHRPQSAAQFRAATVRELVELNLLGVCNAIEWLLPRMRQRGHGHIAAVASLAGYRGLPSASAYGASKAALINLMEALYLDLQGSGIKLQVINPGFVKTPLTARNNFAMPSLISSETAARNIADGLGRTQFEIRFPRGFGCLMALLRSLPYTLYFPLVARATRRQR